MGKERRSQQIGFATPLLGVLPSSPWGPAQPAGCCPGAGRFHSTNQHGSEREKPFSFVLLQGADGCASQPSRCRHIFPCFEAPSEPAAKHRLEIHCFQGSVWPVLPSEVPSMKYTHAPQGRGICPTSLAGCWRATTCICARLWQQPRVLGDGRWHGGRVCLEGWRGQKCSEILGFGAARRLQVGPELVHVV